MDENDIADDLTSQFNTELTPDQKRGFIQWMAEQSKIKGYPAFMDLKNYDMYGAYLDQLKPDSRGHLSDKFKKPNHPTLSQESIYNTPGHEGGQWVAHRPGRWDFQAGPGNLQYQTPEQMKEYFRKYEPNSNLFMPPE